MALTEKEIAEILEIQKLAKKYIGLAINNNLSITDAPALTLSHKIIEKKCENPNQQTYVLPESFQEDYPLITQYMKDYLEKDVMGSDIILQALYEVTSADSPENIGNLVKDKVKEAVAFNSGPEVIATEKPGGMDGAYGYYSYQQNQIQLSSSKLKQVEDTLKSEASKEEKLLVLAQFYMTLLHETAHYGDYLDGLRQDGGEPGDKFERKVWQTEFKKDENGNFILDEDGEKQLLWLFFGDKWDLPSDSNNTDYTQDNIKTIVDRKKQSESGLTTLPTLPDY